MERYLDALLRGDPQGAATAVDEVLDEGWDLMKIYLGLFYPALVRVGELWCEGKINVAQEHLATQMTMAQMERLRARSQIAPSREGGVIVACVEGEEHFIGAMMVADALRFDGWRVDFLGANVPNADLVQTVQQRGIDILALSVTLKSNLPRARRLMAGLGELPNPPRVVVGGAAVTGQEVGVKKLEVETGKDPLEAVEIVRRLMGLEGKRFSFEEFLKELGERIRERRVRLGWTQRALAERAGLDRTYIVAVERGKQNPTLAVVVKIAEALGVAVENLVLPSAAADGHVPRPGLAKKKRGRGGKFYVGPARQRNGGRSRNGL